jgi:flavodoxin
LPATAGENYQKKSLKGEAVKSLIIYHSEHHMNTEKIVKVIAPILEAELLISPHIHVTNIQTYELIGFGSGVYHGEFHENLYNWVYSLPKQDGKKAFLFSTAGSRTNSERANERFRALLKEKGFEVIGDFSCLGFDTALSSAGINRGRPNVDDLKEAEQFAVSLKV